MAEFATRDRLWAYVGAPGKSLFAQALDRRLRTYPTGFDGALEPDLVVFPCGQAAKFDPDAVQLPDPVLGRVRAGLAGIVFDASLEGQPHDPAQTKALHGLIERLGGSLDRAVYITQNRSYATDYADHLRQAGAAEPEKNRLIQ